MCSNFYFIPIYIHIHIHSLFVYVYLVERILKHPATGGVTIQGENDCMNASHREFESPKAPMENRRTRLEKCTFHWKSRIPTRRCRFLWNTQAARIHRKLPPSARSQENSQSKEPFKPKNYHLPDTC